MIIKKIYSVTQNDKRFSFFILVPLLFIASVIEIFSLGLLIPLVESLLEVEQETIFSIYTNRLLVILDLPYESKFSALSLLFIFFYIIKTIYLTIVFKIEGIMIYRLQEAVSRKLFKNFINLGYKDHIDNGITFMINRVKTEVGFLSNSVAALINLFTELFFLIFILLFIISINFKITFSVILFFMIFGFIFMKIISKKLLSLGKKISQNESEKLKFLSQSFHGIEEVKIYDLKKFILENFKKTTNLLFKNNALVYFLKKLPKIYFELIFLIFCISILFFFKKVNYNFVEILPLITFYLAASFKILPSITKILNSFTTFKFCSSAVNNIYNDLKDDTEEFFGLKKNIKFENEIKLKDISFFYDDKKKILNNINLTIKKGDKIIVTGQSGSGKSTLIKIILGFLKPSKGNIRIDNYEYKNLTPEMWRGKAAYVPQETFLFDNTFSENITFEEVHNIAKINLVSKITSLTELKKELEDQGNPNLGDGENKVSGGQKQRIGICRALYRNPDLIIFDESTSSLDKKTEKELIKNTIKHLDNKTLIFITHNTELETYFKKKINLNNGKID
jgi:ATP-binding cassette, subfamily B, bacterial PglK